MGNDLKNQLTVAALPDVVQQALARTPARLFTGRAGAGYTTAQALQLRADHAAARDAVYHEVDPLRDFGSEAMDRLGLFTVQTRATSRLHYLLRPDAGRLLDDTAEKQITQHCAPAPALQIVLGDGLSAQALAHHGMPLLDALTKQAISSSWQLGQPFFIRFCRVGIMNEVGRLLQPEVVVLIIGERPGLAQAESLSAYLAYRPQPGHSDAQRNVISNIHPQGVPLDEAAERILNLAAQLRQAHCSGVAIKETLPVKQLTPLAPIVE